MTNLAVGRPLRENDFAHQRWFHPMGIAPQPSCWRRDERTRLLLDALELRTQFERELVRASGSHLAAEHQAIAFVVPDQECSNPRTHSLGIGEAADDEFLALDALGFHPAAMPSCAIRLVAPFGHDAFESRAARLREERLTAALDVLGETDAAGAAAADKFLQHCLPFFERKGFRVLAVQTEEIEDEVDERAAVVSGSRVLQRLKAGSTIGQHDGYLAVNQRIVEAEFADRVRDFGKRGGPVVAVARV